MIILVMTCLSSVLIKSMLFLLRWLNILSLLWYARLGYLNYRYLKYMCKHGYISYQHDNNDKYEVCIQEKMKKKAFS